MEEPRDQAPAPSGKRWLFIIGFLVVVAIVVFVFWLMGRGWQSTDDAQVQGNLVPISSRVAGYVDRISVDDNQLVSDGQMLVDLDTKDLLARLHSSEANLASAVAQANASSSQVGLVEKTATSGAEQAGSSTTAAGAGVAMAESGIDAAKAQAAAAEAAAVAAQEAVSSARSDITTANAQIESAEASIKQAQANVTSAKAQATKAAADAARFRQLYERGAASKQQLDSAVAANDTAQAAVEAAQETVNTAKAGLSQARARKISAQSALKQASARAVAAQASAKQARVGVLSARTSLSQARARLTGAQAAEIGAKTVPQQVAVSSSQSKAAIARIKQAEADLRNARLQLSYTRIFAPVEGVVSQKSVEPGQYVQPGQLLMALVPLENVWVVANFKETQVEGMHKGQSAKIEVDTYPGQEFKGKIDSIGAATGAQFSLLPPENATGNFVKVVQRIPVKIVLDGRLPKGVVLRPGMSVTANVRVKG